jgi:hypothetical protein
MLVVHLRARWAAAAAAAGALMLVAVWQQQVQAWRLPWQHRSPRTQQMQRA